MAGYIARYKCSYPLAIFLLRDYPKKTILNTEISLCTDILPKDINDRAVYSSESKTKQNPITMTKKKLNAT